MLTEVITGQSQSARPRGHRAVAGALLQLFYISGFLLAISAFTLQLSGVDPTLPHEPGVGSTLSQALLGAIYLTATILLARSPIAGQMLARTWPILLFPLLGLLSALWSPDPGLTSRRAVALLGTILFGLSLTTIYSFTRALHCVLLALATAMVLSVLWALLDPRFGVHQVTDATQAIHAGKWRGIFAHKNVLGGQVAALTFSLFFVYGKVAFGGRSLQLVALAASGACIIFAQSATGFLLAGILIVLGVTLSFLASQAPIWRVAAISFLLLAGVALSLFFQDIADAALTALGRDTDLTGRTTVWAYAWDHMENWLLGYGLYAGFLEMSGSSLELAGFGGTHNGYLDMLVSFGILGSSVGMLCLGWLLVRSIAVLLSIDNTVRAFKTFPACATIFVILHNLVESSLLSGNNLDPLMLAIAAGVVARNAIQQTQEQYLARRRPIVHSFNILR